jgi:hypothetical protein
LYEGFGLVVNGRPRSFTLVGFVMARDLADVHRQVTRVALQTSPLAQHEGDPCSLVFNGQEIYERHDLGTLEREELQIELHACG